MCKSDKPETVLQNKKNKHQTILSVVITLKSHMRIMIFKLYKSILNNIFTVESFYNKSEGHA